MGATIPSKDVAKETIVDYDLIPALFDTSFEETSIEGLPDSKQFFWPMRTSVMNDKEHKEFNKIQIDEDLLEFEVNGDMKDFSTVHENPLKIYCPPLYIKVL